MNGLVVFSAKCWRVLRWVTLAAAGTTLWACTSHTLEIPTIVPSVAGQWNFTQKINNNLDILFMIDNSSSMTSMQQKLLAQLPTFMNVLETLPVAPNLHVAVVSSDMGAPSDVESEISCTAGGNQGEFFSQPEGTCLATTLTAGDTFISDVDGVANFTDPIASVFQCIALLGAKGCGFEHQLASIDRALGGDGLGPAPSQNAGFLRSDAYLGIVMLTNEDDCSAPATTTIYSVNGGQEDIANPDGPVANYRCNGGPHGGHLCKDLNPGGPNMAFATPPLNPPTDAAGTPPMLQLSDCEDNDSGSSALTPVSKFVSDIKALKPHPDSQILVGEIVAPAAPYGVEWVPGAPPPGSPPELWPQVMHSCGAAGGEDVNPDPTTQTVTDGSFGDPGVRETQFAYSFRNSVVASICDANYAQSMIAIANALGILIKPPCIEQKIQNDSQGNPDCSVTVNLTDASNNQTQHAIENCNENGNTAPCWTLVSNMAGCSGQSLKINDTAANMMSAGEDSTVSCALCVPGVPGPGC
jgi:hypothetical protein